MYGSGTPVQHISSVTFDMFGLPGYGGSQMVLGQYFDGKMMVENLDIGMLLDAADQAALNFGSGSVLVVKDAVFGMASFAMKIVMSALVFVKGNSPMD